MPIGHIHASIRQQHKLHLRDFHEPVRATDMEPAGDWCQSEQVVKGMPLVVVEDDHLVLKHALNALFSV